MLRTVIGSTHVLLGALLLLQGILLILQANLNVAWESGFYGDLSIGTMAMRVAGWTSLALAGFLALSGVGFVVGVPAAGWGLLIVGLGLLLQAPAPWSVLGLFTILTVLMDRWVRREREEDQE